MKPPDCTPWPHRITWLADYSNSDYCCKQILILQMYTMVHMTSTTIPVSSRVTPKEKERIDHEVASGRAMNSADFVRQAIREKIVRDREQKEASQ